MKTVILYSRNASIGLKVLYCLYLSNYKIVVISHNKRSSLRFSRYTSEFCFVPHLDALEVKSRVADAINGYGRSAKIEAVIADDISSHALLNAIGDDLDIPSFAPSAEPLLSRCHDKWLFYQQLTDWGIPVPPSMLLTKVEDLTEAGAEAIGYPLLVKPLSGESGHGIVKFDSFRPIIDYLSAPGPYKTFPLKIQKYISGEVLGLSLLALDGKILVSDVQRHAADGARVFYADPEVLSLGERIVASFRYGGPGHIDFIRDKQSKETYALEFNCRYWTSVTVSLWRGGNFPDAAIRLARNETPDPFPTRDGSYYQPGTVVGMCKRPWKLGRLDRANWQGFWQAISDPLPHFLHHLPGR